MSFFQVVIQAFVIFIINTTLSVLLFLGIRNRLQAKLEEWIVSTIHEYIQEQISITLKNPDQTAKALKPLFQAIMSEFMKEAQKEGKEQMVKIPILGKLPAPLVQAFLERFLGGSGSKNEGSNPFA
jgi:low affinity Fe/Cu permease